MPGASASLRSRRMVLRLREDERREEILERRVAFVLPVELLVGALQEAALRRAARHSCFGQEGDVRRGQVARLRDFGERVGERRRAPPSAAGPGRASRRGPVAGVNGTATWSLG